MDSDNEVLRSSEGEEEVEEKRTNKVTHSSDSVRSSESEDEYGGLTRMQYISDPIETQRSSKNGTNGKLKNKLTAAKFVRKVANKQKNTKANGSGGSSSRDIEDSLEASKRFLADNDRTKNMTTRTRPVNITLFIIKVFAWNIVNVVLIAGIMTLQIFFTPFTFKPWGMVITGIGVLVWAWAYFFAQSAFMKVPIINMISMIVVSILGVGVVFAITAGLKWYTMLGIYTFAVVVAGLIYFLVFLTKARLDNVKRFFSVGAVIVSVFTIATLFPVLLYDQSDAFVFWIFAAMSILMVIHLFSEVAEVFQGVSGHHGNMNSSNSAMITNIVISGLFIGLIACIQVFKFAGFILPIPNVFTLTWLVYLPPTYFTAL